MKFAIVPNSLRDAINQKLDAALKTCPAAEPDREYLFNQLLAHFDKHGVIPEFSLAATQPHTEER